MKKTIDVMLRVNLAGEKGACYIYTGQIWACALLGKDSHILRHMLYTEAQHMCIFQKLVDDYGVKSTVYDSLWKTIGWTVGMVSGCAGESAMVAVTEGVESVIVEHYREQCESMEKDHPFHHIFTQCLEDEKEHMHGAQDTFDQKKTQSSSFFKAVRSISASATRAAIFFSERK